MRLYRPGCLCAGRAVLVLCSTVLTYRVSSGSFHRQCRYVVIPSSCWYVGFNVYLPNPSFCSPPIPRSCALACPLVPTDSTYPRLLNRVLIAICICVTGLLCYDGSASVCLSPACHLLSDPIISSPSTVWHARTSSRHGSLAP